jgi:hypothetical protein
MTDSVFRGYVLTQSVSFIESGYFDPQQSSQIMRALPAEVLNALPNIKPQQWYPRGLQISMHRAIAGVRNTEAEIYNDFVAYGAYVCREATNTFLRLFLKLLTPTLFAKKIPEVWQRDHRGSGHFEVDVQRANEGIIQLRLSGAGGFDHIAIPGIGFITHVLKSMGKSDVRMTQQGWSLATPAPDQVSYEITWK